MGRYLLVAPTAPTQQPTAPDAPLPSHLCLLFLAVSFTSITETDRVGLGDFVSYHLENAVAANGSVPFYLLIGLCVFISVGAW